MTASPSVVILAGGQGLRIGGGKPLRRLCGETLLDRALRTARPWSDDLRILVRDPNQVRPLPAPQLQDDPEIAGPLGGLAAALRHAAAAERAAVLTLPCDMPFLPADLSQRLAAAIGSRSAAVAASAGELHPVCALWRTEALDVLPAYLETGRRSLRGFAALVGFAEAEWAAEPHDPFFNINSEADLRQAEAILAGRGV